MSYDYYFAGEVNKDTSDYKRKYGLNQLLSQLNDRKDILDWVEYLKEHPECHSKLFIDSGAFSVYKSGKTVDVDAYIEFINSIDDYVTVFAQVDSIPKPNASQEEIDVCCQESWDNFLYMVDKVNSPKKLVPVFHQGDNIKWLIKMLDYKYPDGTYLDYVGISANKMLGHAAWEMFFDTCMHTIHNHPNCNVKTHAFGTTNKRMVESYPFTSSDSTTWLKQGIYGTLINPLGMPINGGRRSDLNGFDMTNKLYIQSVIDDYPEYFSSVNTPEELVNNSKLCQMFNLISVHKWIMKLQKTKSNMYQNQTKLVLW